MRGGVPRLDDGGLMLALLVVVAGLLAFEALVWRYGADSRDGNDWVVPRPTRRSPSIR